MQDVNQINSEIKVINEWILVKPEKDQDIKENVTPGGIIVPRKVQKEHEEVKRALVIQISEDIDETLHYQPGDTILYYGKTGISLQGGEYMFLRFDGMLAIERKTETAKEIK
jgi:co-chaperonin GroES (HSP10)